jgi:hypothetical protein
MREVKNQSPTKARMFLIISNIGGKGRVHEWLGFLTTMLGMMKFAEREEWTSRFPARHFCRTAHPPARSPPYSRRDAETFPDDTLK